MTGCWLLRMPISAARFILDLLKALKLTLAEPDIDWSSMLKVKGDVSTKNLRLGASASDWRPCHASARAAVGLALRATPDVAGANAALDTAQIKLDRFLLPINPG